MKQIDYSELWDNLPWKKFQKSLFRLQVRLYKASRANDKKRVRNLQNLILRSQAARFLAIRQVTQLNQGRRTAGVDGKKALNAKERLELEKVLKTKATDWKHEGLREIPTPKKDGSKRILKIPTIKDRAWQKLVLYVIEPAHEALFHENSYGFRTGRSAHDALQKCNGFLNSGSNGIGRRILELDIEKCFDRIEHKDLMGRIIAPQRVKLGLWRCLKAGVSVEFPEQGTPQGGIISPLLANIALNGVEKIGEYAWVKSKGMVTKTKNISPRRKTQIYSICVRYADDMVFILDEGDDAEALLEEIKEFLKVRGLNIKATKTKLVKSTEGFDFLGWNIKVKKDGKYTAVPSKDNYEKFKKKVEDIVNDSCSGAQEKARKLAPIIRGWRNYHKYCDMSKHNLWSLNHATYKRFMKEKNMTRDEAERLVKKAFPKVGYKIAGYAQVKRDKSPYDGDLTYWSKRNSKLYFGELVTELKEQEYKCTKCGLTFQPGDKVELHHKDGNHKNWKKDNLEAVHRQCHHVLHKSKRRKA